MDAGKKILVIYYSRKSDKERRKDAEDIASWIAGAVDGDLFRVETVDEYPPDDLTYADRLRSEDWHRMNPPAKRYLPSVRDYGIIFVGFPNWAGIVPRVIYTFLSDHNLKGKRVIPFGINEKPEYMGNVVELRKVCGEARVEDGFFVVRKGLMKRKSEFVEWARTYTDL